MQLGRLNQRVLLPVHTGTCHGKLHITDILLLCLAYDVKFEFFAERGKISRNRQLIVLLRVNFELPLAEVILRYIANVRLPDDGKTELVVAVVEGLAEIAAGKFGDCVDV